MPFLYRVIISLVFVLFFYFLYRIRKAESWVAGYQISTPVHSSRGIPQTRAHLHNQHQKPLNGGGGTRTHEIMSCHCKNPSSSMPHKSHIPMLAHLAHFIILFSLFTFKTLLGRCRKNHSPPFIYFFFQK